jgi:hypothetical protein
MTATYNMDFRLYLRIPYIKQLSRLLFFRHLDMLLGSFPSPFPNIAVRQFIRGGSVQNWPF